MARKKGKKKKKKPKKIAKRVKRNRVRLVKKFSDLVREKLKDNVKAVFTFGSGVRKDKGFNDIDVAVLLDDTKLKRSPSRRMKNDLFDRLNKLAKDEVDDRIHAQIYFLSKFWNNVRYGDPIIMSIVKDAIVVYDVGIIEPVRLMLKKGLITGTKESIDRRLEMGPDILKAAENKMTSVIRPLDDAVIESSRAVIIEAGLISPPPNKVPEIFNELFVKEGLVKKKYGKTLKKIHKTYKDWEHGDLKNLSGKEIDKLKKEAEDFLEQIPKLVKKVKVRKRAKSIDRALEECAKAMKDALASVGKKDVKKPISAFEKEFVGKDKPLANTYWNSFLEVARIHKKKKTKGIDSLRVTDALDARDHSHRFSDAVYEVIKPKSLRIVESKPHVVCKTKDGYSLAWFCEDRIFAIPDPKNKQVLEAKMGKKSLNKFHKSSLDKLAKALEGEKEMSIRKEYVKGLKKKIGKPEDMFIEYGSGYKVKLDELV